jgi:transposase
VIWEKIAADRLKVIEGRQKEIEALKLPVKERTETIARLEKNSTNSSKAPSSDITSPPKKDGETGEKRRQGAQKGHERPPFPPEQSDTVIVHELSHCPCCGGQLEPAAENAETRQQIELVTKPYQITEHQYNRYWCETCQAYHTAPIAEAERNLFGPKLMAVTG